jgi:hypothetical protein
MQSLETLESEVEKETVFTFAELFLARSYMLAKALGDKKIK